MKEAKCESVIREWIGSNYDVQQLSLFSHSQFTGSFRHTGHTVTPQPTHVLSTVLQAQWLHAFVFNFTYIILTYYIRFSRENQRIQSS